MPTAVLLFATTLTLAVLTGIGWLTHTVRPHRTRIRIPAVLSVDVGLDADPVGSRDRRPKVESCSGAVTSFCLTAAGPEEPGHRPSVR